MASKRDEHIEAYSTWKKEDCKAWYAGSWTNIQIALTLVVDQVNI